MYIGGLPYSDINARVLLRAIYWAADAEADFESFHTGNPLTECAFYEETGRVCVINNANTPQTTSLCFNGNTVTVTLEPLECKWL